MRAKIHQHLQMVSVILHISNVFFSKFPLPRQLRGQHQSCACQCLLQPLVPPAVMNPNLSCHQDTSRTRPWAVFQVAVMRLEQHKSDIGNKKKDTFSCSIYNTHCIHCTHSSQSLPYQSGQCLKLSDMQHVWRSIKLLYISWVRSIH